MTISNNSNTARIADKWKVFAIGQVLSSHGAKVDPVTLYHWIEQTDDDQMEALFDDYDVVVWQPFKNWPLSDVVNHLTELATRAQETATGLIQVDESVVLDQPLLVERGIKTEFPKHPPLEPELLALFEQYGFTEDSSYHNDECPSRMTPNSRWQLWHFHPNPVFRETDAKRFIVSFTSSEGQMIGGDSCEAETIDELASELAKWQVNLTTTKDLFHAFLKNCHAVTVDDGPMLTNWEHEGNDVTFRWTDDEELSETIEAACIAAGQFTDGKFVAYNTRDEATVIRFFAVNRLTCLRDAKVLATANDLRDSLKESLGFLEAWSLYLIDSGNARAATTVQEVHARATAAYENSK